MSEKIGTGTKVCIIGYGSIGRRHADNFESLGCEVYFLRSGQSHPDRPKTSQQLPEVFSLDEALAQKPDLAVVANPSSFHIDSALPFAEQGCNLLIEKPLLGYSSFSGSVGESDEWKSLEKLKKIIEEKKLICSSGYMMRYHPQIMKAKKWLEENRIGKVLSGHFHWGTPYVDWHPWEDYKKSYAAQSSMGGGVVLTCSHEIDLARFLLGDVKSCLAHHSGSTKLELDCEDHANLFFIHESGVSSTIHLNYHQRPNERFFKIIGDLGVIDWCFDKMSLSFTNHESGQTEVMKLAHSPVDQLYLDEAIDLLGAHKNRREIQADFHEGLKTWESCVAALISLKQTQLTQVGKR